MRHKAPLPAVLICASLAGSAAAQPELGDSLEDREFRRLFTDLSEPGGDFADENYVSNELGLEAVLPALERAIAPGGVYLGVGPEQNFSYLAALRPRIAFIVDVRRQNAMEHLMYKALFEMSASRADFVSRLFSRPRPPGLDRDTPAEAMLEAYAAVAADRELFERSLASVLRILNQEHGLALRAEDETSIDKVLNAFFEGGPDIRYIYQDTDEWHPSYTRLMTMIDEQGRNWSYLGSEESFTRVRSMQIRNLIVPVVGDFAGPKALRAIGDYLRARDATVDVFYVSNVEPYLFRNGLWRAFYDNVATLPVDESSVFVRTFFGSTARECAALRPRIRMPAMSSIEALTEDYRSGDIESQCALVERSYPP